MNSKKHWEKSWGYMTESDDQLLLWIALGRVHSLGPVLTKRLLEAFRSPKAIFAASHDQLVRIKGVSDNIANSIKSAPDIEFAERQMEIAHRRGVRVVTRESAEYPSRLRQIYDPPFLLYVKGDLCESDNRAVAIVGSRHATHYGKSMAEELSLQLAEAGVTVVSGFARGIDSISHRAAMATGGRTIAVLGCGLDIIYPPENVSLYEQMPSHGAIVSEFPLETKPEGPNFPRRNRIISGLCLGVVVVEAARRSGALLTAGHALEQNREVFAVPGNVTSATSTGTNALIRQGAHLVTNADDILAELEFMIPNADDSEPKAVPAVKVDGEQAKLLNLMGEEPAHIDALSRASGLTVQRLLELLLTMELKGAVAQMPGKKFVKCGVRLYNGKSS
jgi:DNA processing protein